jgi:DNA modification methylase
MKKCCFRLAELDYVLFKENNSFVDSLPSSIVDVLIVDGPYGIVDGGCDWDNFNLSERKGREDFYLYHKSLFAKALPRLKRSGSILIFNYPEGAAIIKTVLDNEFELVFRRWITWVYENHFDYDRGTNFRRSHEAILYYTISDNYVFNTPALPDVITHPIVKADECEFKEGAKPIEVVKKILSVVAVPGGTVLSLFAGSGTDFLAANACGMHAIGFEYNPYHVDILTRRMKSNGATII